MLQQGSHIRRQGSGKAQLLPGNGVSEGDPGAVQRLPGEAVGGASVQLVAQQRPALFRHMHPDLVGAAGMQDKADQRAAAVRGGRQHPVFGHGAFAVRGNDALHFQGDLALQRQVD